MCGHTYDDSGLLLKNQNGTSTDSIFYHVQLMALLHGHSYTAHAMGCTAALKAMQWYRDPSTNLNIDTDHMKLKEVMTHMNFRITNTW